MEVIDSFLYNGEVELLKLRLHILSPYVDTFNVVEAKTTFSGKKKELFFPRQEYRLKKFWKKIRYHVIDEKWSKEEWQLVKSAHESTGGLPHWEREFLQKESVKKALVGASDGAWCFIGDADEIWNPEVLSLPLHPISYKLKQKVYTYFLDLRSTEQWAGTFVAPYGLIKYSCVNYMRTQHQGPYIENGGWHFTNMGGLERLTFKIESYGHQEYNTPQVKGNLAAYMASFRDYIGRDFHLSLDEADWPQYLKKNKRKFAHLCHPKT